MLMAGGLDWEKRQVFAPLCSLIWRPDHILPSKIAGTPGLDLVQDLYLIGTALRMQIHPGGDYQSL